MSAGVHRAARRARLGAVRGEGRRAARAGPGRLQGAGAGPRLQHLRADRVGARDLGAHHGAVPHRAAPAPERHRAASGPQGDLLQGHMAAAARGEVTQRSLMHTSS